MDNHKENTAHELSNNQYKVALVIRSELLLEGLRLLLSPFFKVVDEAVDENTAVQLASHLDLAVLIVATGIPHFSALHLVRQLSSQFPHIRLLVVSLNDTNEPILDIVRSGAHGYISSTEDSQVLINSIYMVASGGYYFGMQLTEAEYTAWITQLED